MSLAPRFLCHRLSTGARRRRWGVQRWWVADKDKNIYIYYLLIICAISNLVSSAKKLRVSILIFTKLHINLILVISDIDRYDINCCIQVNCFVLLYTVYMIKRYWNLLYTIYLCSSNKEYLFFCSLKSSSLFPYNSHASARDQMSSLLVCRPIANSLSVRFPKTSLRPEIHLT